MCFFEAMSLEDVGSSFTDTVSSIVLLQGDELDGEVIDTITKSTQRGIDGDLFVLFVFFDGGNEAIYQGRIIATKKDESGYNDRCPFFSESDRCDSIKDEETNGGISMHKDLFLKGCTEICVSKEAAVGSYLVNGWSCGEC